MPVWNAEKMIGKLFNVILCTHGKVKTKMAAIAKTLLLNHAVEQCKYKLSVGIFNVKKCT